MQKHEALELARSLLRPAGALCDLVTRGPGWPLPSECGEYKRAVGHVMGKAYSLLMPIWEEHPDLNPGLSSNTDPLGFASLPDPPLTTPAGLLPYLEETDLALETVVSRMLANPSIGQAQGFHRGPGATT